ncbi:UNVERIFIED_CONTAM: hypothetical protein HDU68_003413 [Siphonaria sp. JEL0065]|nr:hypothetical protein HDU68_003413 [Siphonaria sp. JEL0065]
MINAFRAKFSCSAETLSSTVTIPVPKSNVIEDSFSSDVLEQTSLPKAAPIATPIVEKPQAFGLKSFWDVFGNSNSSKTVTTTTITESSRPAYPVVEEQPIYTKPALPQAPPPTPTTQKVFEDLVLGVPAPVVIVEEKTTDETVPVVIQEAPANSTSETSVSSSSNVWLKKRSFADVVQNVPETSVLVESRTTTTKTTTTESSKDAEFETISWNDGSEEEVTRSVVDSSPTPSVRDIARGFNANRSTSPKHYTPRRSSLHQKRSSVSDHFKTIVTTTTTKTIKNDKGEEEVVVEQNVEVVEDDTNVPAEVVTSGAPIVKVVETIEKKESENVVVVAQPVVTVVEEAVLAHTPEVIDEMTVKPRDVEVVAFAAAAVPEVPTASTISQPFAFLSQATSAITPFVTDAIKTVQTSIHPGVTESTKTVETVKEEVVTPLSPKKKKRALITRFKSTGPGVLFSDIEESSDDETPMAKTPIAMPRELSSNTTTTTTTTTTTERIASAPVPSVSVTIPGAPESKPEPKPTTTTRAAHYMAPTASSTHHANSFSSLSPAKKFTKNDMLAMSMDMEARMASATKKRTTLQIPAFKKTPAQSFISRAVEAATGPAVQIVETVKSAVSTSAVPVIETVQTSFVAPGTEKFVETVQSVSTSNAQVVGNVQSDIATPVITEKAVDVVKTLSSSSVAPVSAITENSVETANFTLSLNDTNITSTIASPVVDTIQSTATPVVEQVVKTVTTTSTISTTIAPPPPQKKPIVFSETYRNHISESASVLTVCESELKARYRDYQQFSKSDLEAWFEEIKATSNMFVDIGGQVLEAEWNEHGFKESDLVEVVAPHVQLVERARKIVDELDRFRELIV